MLRSLKAHTLFGLAIPALFFGACSSGPTMEGVSTRPSLVGATPQGGDTAKKGPLLYSFRDEARGSGDLVGV